MESKLHGRQIGSHDIADIGKIARLLTVAVDGEQLIAQKCANELMESHVRALARAIDTEVAKGDGRQPMLNSIESAEMFRGKFGHPIGGNRRGSAILACGLVGRIPIY